MVHRSFPHLLGMFSALQPSGYGRSPSVRYSMHLWQRPFQQCCSHMGPLVLTMFQSIAQALSLPNIKALASFITSTHSEFLPGIDIPDTKDIEVFWYLQEYQQCSCAAQYQYRLPTCVEVLLLWCVLSGLLSLVPLPQHTSIMKVPSPGGATTTPAGLGSKPKSYGEGGVQGWP